MNKNRVVITGLGPVSAIGIGVKEFEENVFNLKTNLKPIPEIYERDYRFKSRFYSPFPEFNLKDFEISTKFERIIQDGYTKTN